MISLQRKEIVKKELLGLQKKLDAMIKFIEKKGLEEELNKFYKENY